METTLHDVHHQQNGGSSAHEDEESNEASHHAATGHDRGQHLIEEDLSQLRVSKGQSPKSQVRCSVGNGS